MSRICQAIGDEFSAWSGRRLDGLELDYLFLDASMFKMHPGARAEPVLAAWGIDTDGKPVFVALAAGGSESTDAWASFLDELRGRGLRPPLLVISDGAAGLISATESVLARSLRQKCLIHRCRNVVAKVPRPPTTRSGTPTGRSLTPRTWPPLASWGWRESRRRSGVAARWPPRRG